MPAPDGYDAELNTIDPGTPALIAWGDPTEELPPAVYDDMIDAAHQQFIDSVEALAPTDPDVGQATFFNHDGVRSFLKFFCQCMQFYPDARPIMLALAVFTGPELALIDAVAQLGITACRLNNPGPN